jgi:sugar O-acyltransferase (sialic acid O-acetyltransferase NeuD family)
MKAERVVLVGGGDYGRGVLEILRARQEAGAGLEAVGFVDDRLGGETIGGLPCLGSVEWLEEKLASLDASVILSLADPDAKKALASRLDAAGATYSSVVHPGAEVSPSVELAAGCVVGAGAVIVYDTRVGPHVSVNLNATIGHHVELGAFSTVAPGVNLLGKVRIGEGCQIHANAVVLPSVAVGDRAVVGAGSVVLGDVPAGTKVFGNPARPVPAGANRPSRP